MKEKTIENAWSILLKFGKEENLQKLQAGQFYMKNLQYYVDLEKGTSDEDVGDMYDGQMMLQDVKISVFTTDTHEFLGQISAPTASFNLGYLKCPVFCMFMMDYRNHVSERLDGDTLMPPDCAACPAALFSDFFLRQVLKVVQKDFFLRLFRQSGKSRRKRTAI